MFSMNNTERGGGEGRWRGDGRNSLDLGSCCTLYRVILDPNFFAVTLKNFPPFKICLDKFHLKKRNIVYFFPLQHSSKWQWGWIEPKKDKNSPVYSTIINYRNTNIELDSFRVLAIGHLKNWNQKFYSANCESIETKSII